MPRKPPKRRGWRIKDLSEIEVPQYSAEAIQEVAAILGVDDEAGFSVLGVEVKDIAVRYVALKHLFDKAPKVAEKRVALGEVKQAVDVLLDLLENLDDETQIALSLAASGSSLSSTEAKLGSRGSREAYLTGEEEIEAVTGHVYNLEMAVSTALKLMPEPKRGRPTSFANCFH